MQHELPGLPYAKDALEPHISAETLMYHHDKHHAAYVAKLNDLIQGTEFEDASLEDIVTRSSGPIFNNAAQDWNHTFYWNCMAPGGGGQAQGALADAIRSKWGSFETFMQEFSKAGAGLFGSGWVWLVRGADSVAIVPMGNAGNPMTQGQTPLLVMDVWEHAYYIDYRNARPEYITHFFDVLNWAFVEQNYEAKVPMAAALGGK